MKEYLNKSILTIIFAILYCVSCMQNNNPKYYYSLAVNELNNENYDQSEKLFTKAIELDSTYGQAYFMRAQVKRLLYFDKDIICIDLKKAQRLGYIQAKDVHEQFCREIPPKEIDSLIATFNLFIETNPNRFEGFYDRANLYFDIGKFEEAIKDYSRAIVLEEYPVAYYNRGLCYIQIGMKQEGCKDLKRSAELGYVVTIEQLDFCN